MASASNESVSKANPKRKLAFGSEEDKCGDTDDYSSSPFTPTKTEPMQGTPVKEQPISTPTKRRISFDYWESKRSSREAKSPAVPAESTTPKKPSSTERTAVLIKELKLGYMLDRSLMFRVSGKFGVKSTQNGKVLRFHGIDASGEIAFVAFHNEVEKWCDLIEMNVCFEIENFRVVEESKKFPSGTGNEFQINLNLNSRMSRLDDDGGLPKIPLNIIPLNEVEKQEVKASIDTIGVLITDWGFEHTATGHEKRDLSITDSTKRTIMVTLWGVDADSFKANENSVILIRRSVVSLYYGEYSLNCNSTTMVWVDPEIPEAMELKSWFKEADNEEEKKDAK